MDWVKEQEVASRLRVKRASDERHLNEEEDEEDEKDGDEYVQEEKHEEYGEKQGYDDEIDEEEDEEEEEEDEDEDEDEDASLEELEALAATPLPQVLWHLRASTNPVDASLSEAAGTAAMAAALEEWNGHVRAQQIQEAWWTDLRPGLC